MASTARIDELQKKFDENPRRYFAPLANEYRKSGQVDRAIALCREHLSKQPGHMSGHIVYGQALYEVGEREEAQRVFRLALDLDPENVIALRHMGDIERVGGDAAEARRWYTRVLDADPHDSHVTSLIISLDAARAASPVSAAEPIPTLTDDANELSPGAGRQDEQEGDEQKGIDAELEQLPALTEPSDAFGDDAFADPLMDASLDVGPAFADESLLTTTAGDILGGQSESWWEPVPGASAGSEESGGVPGALAAAAGEMPGAPAAAEGDDVLVLPIEAFGYDAEHEAAAATAAELPSIDAFAYDVAGEEEGNEEPRPIEAFGYDEPSTDEFLPDVADDAEMATPLFAEDMEAPGAVPEVAAASRDAGSPFVTETMAELYLRQGFRDEALGVYRQLLASDPYNVAISAKVSELTGEFPSVSQQGAASAPVAERASVDVASEEAVEAPTASSTPPHGDVLAPALGAAGSAGAPVPGVESATNARAFFASLITRRPRRPDWPRPEATTETAPVADPAGEAAGPFDAAATTDVESRSQPEPAPGDAPAPSGLGFGTDDLDSFVEPPEGAGPEGELLMIEAYSYDRTHAPGTDAAAGATTLDALFGHAPVAPEDTAAASALAAAFGTPAADAGGDQREAPGRPARPATAALSLDEIFRSGGNDAAATRRTTPTAFSFDQFFTDDAPAAAPGSGGPDAAQSARLGEESAGDLDRFNAWLDALKRK